MRLLNCFRNLIISRPLPNGLTITQGDGQSGTVFTALAVQCQVTVKNGATPLSNIPVLFSSVDSGDTGTVVYTTETGVASYGWTLGERAGTQTLNVQVRKLTATFSATAAAAAASLIRLVAGGQQTAVVSTTLPIAISVRVEDGNGNGVPSFALTGSITAGGGSGVGLSGNTDASGNFTITSWTMGAGAGIGTLHFAGAGGLTLDIDASATAAPLGPPAILVRVSGNNQSGVVAGAAPAALTLEVQDSNGAVLPNVQVSNSIAAGNGTIAGGDATLTTNGSGRITFTPTATGVLVGQNLYRCTVGSPSGNLAADFAVNTVAGAAVAVILTRQVSSPVGTGVAFVQQPTGKIVDANGNTCLTNASTVTAAHLSGPSTIGGTLTAVCSAGLFAFVSLKYTGAGGPNVIRYSDGALTVADGDGITVGTPVTDALRWVTHPAASVAQDQVFPIAIEALSGGVRNTGDNTTTVALTLSVNPGNDQLSVSSGTMTAGLLSLNETVRVPIWPLPLDELAGSLYQGSPGFFYNGTNGVPAAHVTAGAAKAALVVPRNSAGTPQAGGKYVLISTGISITSQAWRGIAQVGVPAAAAETWSFEGIAAADGTVEHTDMVIKNGACAGNGTVEWDGSIDQSLYNNVRDVVLPQGGGGLTEAQIQVAIMDVVTGNPIQNGYGTMPAANSDALNLLTRIGNQLRLMKTRWPNLQIVFLGARNYAGYSTTQKSLEPYAYEVAFAIKWAIQAQIDQMNNGGTVVDGRVGNLNYNTGVAPWIAWPTVAYPWANRLNPRASDGLVWDISDFEADGMHPSQLGETKIANLWLSHFKTDPRCTPWFLA